MAEESYGRGKEKLKKAKVRSAAIIKAQIKEIEKRHKRELSKEQLLELYKQMFPDSEYEPDTNRDDFLLNAMQGIHRIGLSWMMSALNWTVYRPSILDQTDGSLSAKQMVKE